jgi:diguanylate cyclase (GGDEF)-like protein
MQLTTIARGAPLVSYSVDPARQLSELSRASGFVSHLTAPLRPSEVEQRLALVARGDLANRLRQAGPTLQRRIGRVEVLARFVREVNEHADPRAVADVVLRHAPEWIPAPSFAVVAWDPSGAPAVIANRGLSQELDLPARELGGIVLRQEQDYAVASLTDDQRLNSGVAAAAIALPLRCRNTTVAVLVAMDPRPAGRTPQFVPSALAALRILLETAGIAFDNALRVQRVEELSVTDDLTQLYNSRYLNQSLHRETKRAARGGRPLSLLFVDLDGFKSINDAYGHLHGSRALVEAAAVIRRSARETDVVARFGGDEFALVLPDTGVEGAKAVGERVRERIAAHEFLAGEGLRIRLSASVGLATLPDVATTAEELLQAADRAMYWVKDHGKNGIRVARPAEDARLKETPA